MMRSNYTCIMHVDAVTEALDNLNTADAWVAKEAVESITFLIGRKGDRFPEYLSVRSIAKAIDPFLMRYVESMVTSACVPNEELYYIGNPDY